MQIHSNTLGLFSFSSWAAFSSLEELTKGLHSQSESAAWAFRHLQIVWGWNKSSACKIKIFIYLHAQTKTLQPSPWCQNGFKFLPAVLTQLHAHLKKTSTRTAVTADLYPQCIWTHLELRMDPIRWPSWGGKWADITLWSQRANNVSVRHTSSSQTHTQPHCFIIITSVLIFLKSNIKLNVVEGAVLRCKLFM